MEELANTMAELDVIKQLAELMKSLDDDGKRRALWYLADIHGLAGRQQAQMPLQARPAAGAPTNVPPAKANP